MMRLIYQTYQTEGFHDAWALYCIVAGFKPRPWQQRMIEQYYLEHEVCWNWCRGSGKTLIMSHLYIFERIAGIVIDPFWIAAAWSQLNRSQIYWSTNPFCMLFSPSKMRDRITLKDGGVILFTSATDDNVNGPRGGSVKYDEVARMSERVFWNSIPIASHIKAPYRIFSSTPISHSVFHVLTESYPTYTQTYLDCPEMNHEAIEALKETMPLWLWNLNYMCLFTLPEGVVFPNITESKATPPNGLRIVQGVDFGITPGHTMVKVGIDKVNRKVYILGESLFRYKAEHDKLKEQCHLYPTEVESGGFNESFAPYFKGRNITQAPFTNESKYERINWLLERELIINPDLCPKTLEHMRAAQWEITKSGKPKVETGSLHNLAALMHAIGAKESYVDVGTPDYNRQRPRMRKY